jgi:hypothetical protein
LDHSGQLCQLKVNILPMIATYARDEKFLLDGVISHGNDSPKLEDEIFYVRRGETEQHSGRTCPSGDSWRQVPSSPGHPRTLRSAGENWTLDRARAMSLYLLFQIELARKSKGRAVCTYP